MADLRETLEVAHRIACEHELVVVMHPDDVTDDVRREIAAAPLTTLNETTLANRGSAYLIRPALFDQYDGVPSRV